MEESKHYWGQQQACGSSAAQALPQQHRSGCGCKQWRGCVQSKGVLLTVCLVLLTPQVLLSVPAPPPCTCKRLGGHLPAIPHPRADAYSGIQTCPSYFDPARSQPTTCKNAGNPVHWALAVTHMQRQWYGPASMGGAGDRGQRTGVWGHTPLRVGPASTGGAGDRRAPLQGGHIRTYVRAYGGTSARRAHGAPHGVRYSGGRAKNWLI